MHLDNPDHDNSGNFASTKPLLQYEKTMQWLCVFTTLLALSTCAEKIAFMVAMY